MKGKIHMSDDITARIAAQEARLAEMSATLADHADAVMKAVDAWKVARDDRSRDLLALPVAALLKNVSNADAWSNAVAAMPASATEYLPALLSAAGAINAALATRLDYPGAVEATALAAELKPAAAAAAMLPYDPDVIHALTTAVAAYDVAESTYQSALRDQAQRDKPATTRQTSRGGGGSRGGGRGTGQWEADHGWHFHATCDVCGNAVTSRSNLGSFQNDLAKHAGVHRNVVRVYERDIDPTNREIWQGFTDAMYQVADGAEVADGGGFHIVQVREVAAA